MSVTKLLGVAAIGAVLAMAAPADRAQALSLLNPGVAAAAQEGAAAPTTEVRWHHGHWRRHWHGHRHWHPRRHWHHWHRHHW